MVNFLTMNNAITTAGTNYLPSTSSLQSIQNLNTGNLSMGSNTISSNAIASGTNYITYS